MIDSLRYIIIGKSNGSVGHLHRQFDLIFSQ